MVKDNLPCFRDLLMFTLVPSSLILHPMLQSTRRGFANKLNTKKQIKSNNFKQTIKIESNL